MTRVPILVQFEYHPASAEAAAMAEHLRAVISDDPAVPGLRIPTCFTADDRSSMPPAPRLDDEADRVLVVLLADDQLAAHAKDGNNGLTWGDYAVGLRELCDASPNHRFLPVSLSKFVWPIDPRLKDLNFLRAFDEPDDEQRMKLVARRMLHLLIRRLRPHATDEDAPPVTIFLSHAKMDVGRKPGVVNALVDYLRVTQPEKAWFDSGDIASGSRFAKAIEDGVTDSALLAVATDAYSSRSWCRREVLFAKRHQRPFVIVDALQDREIRRFPYAGNGPVLRWRDDPRDVLDAQLRQAFALLREYPSLGDFLAFQFAIDLNYSELTDFSEMDFVVAGPGARDGIRKCFREAAGLSEARIIQLMAERASHEFERLGITFQSLWGRSLQLIDCQNVFCEVSKYARVAHPAVPGVSGRTRIKQRYSPRSEPIPQWYPPKWGINARLLEGVRTSTPVDVGERSAGRCPSSCTQALLDA